MHYCYVWFVRIPIFCIALLHMYQKIDSYVPENQCTNACSWIAFMFGLYALLLFCIAIMHIYHKSNARTQQKQSNAQTHVRALLLWFVHCFYVWFVYFPITHIFLAVYILADAPILLPTTPMFQQQPYNSVKTPFLSAKEATFPPKRLKNLWPQFLRRNSSRAAT